MLSPNSITILKDCVPTHQYPTEYGDKIIVGYGYDIVENLLVLPKSEIDSFYTDGLSKIKADKLLLLECKLLHSELSRELDWFAKLDDVTSFAITAMAKQIGIISLLRNKKALSYVKEGKFNLASLELKSLKIKPRLLTMLRLGRL